MGKFNWAELGMQAASQGLGMVMGLFGQGAADRRQIRMQEQLQAMQIRGQKEMTDYNTMKQLEMWQNTSYPAQMEMIKKAGLNPALLYGMGGGGGQTASISPGNVSAGNAPTGGGEIMQGLQMGMQLQLLKAQKDNIEADTKNKLASAGNTGEQWLKLQYENVINDILTNTDLQGQPIKPGEDHKRIAVAAKIAEVLSQQQGIKNAEQALKLMQQQGATQEAMEQEIQKQIKLLQQEIDFGELDLKGDNAGKFLANFLRMLVKPR